MPDSDTVLSFHEEPTIEPAPPGLDPEEWKRENLESMRANMLSVLMQISKHGFFRADGKANPLTQSSVRKALEAKKSKRSRLAIPQKDLLQILAKEGASNIYYYLFEDYAAAGPFQAARDTLSELVSPAIPMMGFTFADSYQTPIVLQSDVRETRPARFQS